MKPNFLFPFLPVLVYVGDAVTTTTSSTASKSSTLGGVGTASGTNDIHGVSAQLLPGLGEPYFADEHGNGLTVNTTAQLGITTYLHCKVNSLGGKTVSNVVVVMKRHLSKFGSEVWLDLVVLLLINFF